jgi:hypothetical protein
LAEVARAVSVFAEGESAGSTPGSGAVGAGAGVGLVGAGVGSAGVWAGGADVERAGGAFSASESGV